RAVEFARRHGVTIRARSSFSDNPGTLVAETIENKDKNMEEPIISGIATDKSEAKITVIGIPDIPGKAAQIFNVVAAAGANIDMIVQNVSAAATGLTDISFTLPMEEGSRVIEALSNAKEDIGFDSLRYDDQIAKLALVGAGMRVNSGVSAKLFTALSDAGVNIEMISTSEIPISVVTRARKDNEAMRAGHSAFELDGGAGAHAHPGPRQPRA